MANPIKFAMLVASAVYLPSGAMAQTQISDHEIRVIIISEKINIAKNVCERSFSDRAVQLDTSLSMMIAEYESPHEQLVRDFALEEANVEIEVIGSEAYCAKLDGNFVSQFGFSLFERR